MTPDPAQELWDVVVHSLKYSADGTYPHMAIKHDPRFGECMLVYNPSEYTPGEQPISKQVADALIEQAQLVEIPSNYIPSSGVKYWGVEGTRA